MSEKTRLGFGVFGESSFLSDLDLISEYLAETKSEYKYLLIQGVCRNGFGTSTCYITVCFSIEDILDRDDSEDMKNGIDTHVRAHCPSTGLYSGTYILDTEECPEKGVVMYHDNFRSWSKTTKDLLETLRYDSEFESEFRDGVLGFSKTKTITFDKDTKTGSFQHVHRMSYITLMQRWHDRLNGRGRD